MSEVVINVRAEDSFSGVLGNFGSIMTGIKSTIDLVAGAFNAVVDFGKQFTDSAIESENAIMELEAVLKATGGAAGLTSEELQNMANHLQNVTMFSDETIIAGQSMLLTFRNIGEDTFPRATEAMLDMATMFGSVDSAAVQLGKALNDPIAGISALQRIGIQFTDEQKEMIEGFMEMGDIASAQNIILKEVEMQIGGLSRAMGDTFAGQAEIFKNKIDEVKEGIGNLILFALKPVLEYFNGDSSIGIFITTLSSALGDLNERLGNGVPLFQALALTLKELPENTDLLSELPPVLQTITDTLFDMQAVLDEGGSMWDALALGADRLSQIIGDAFAKIDWAGILASVDQTLANVINSIDWRNVGDAFGDALMGSLENELGEGGQSNLAAALGNALNEFFLGAMGYVDWNAAGQALDDALNNFFIDLFNINEIKQGWADIGAALVDGISTGFNDGIDGLIANATNFWRTFINNAKAVLGIASPSTVFAQIGRDIISGLIGGFTGMAGALLSAVGNIVDDVVSAFQPVIDLITGGDGSMGGQLGTHAGAGSTGSTGTGAPGTGPGGTTTTTGAMVVNQYFAGANITVGSWDEIAYDCIYPNPFVSATSGQLGSGGGGGGGAMVR